jgi:uncharacterized protein YunC (DUF1805 family)
MSELIDISDTRRCQSSSHKGQCTEISVLGTDHCVKHTNLEKVNAVRTRKYFLSTADQSLYEHYADDNQLTSLRDEIAILRMMMQNTLSTAQSEVERVNAYSKVNYFILSLERVMKTCISLEMKLNELVGKAALMRLGQQLCQILVNRLTGVPNYEQLIDAIIKDMAHAFENVGNTNDEFEIE